MFQEKISREGFRIFCNLQVEEPGLAVPAGTQVEAKERKPVDFD